jgi:predicted nucleotidyltransferase
MTLEGLHEDFRDLLVVFADTGVEFVIVGAYALALHGAPRASGDIDLFIRATPDNAERVFAALARFGAPLEAAGISAVDFARPALVYQIGLPPRRIDVLTEISGVSFDEVWESRLTVDVEGRSIGFIGRAAFLKNKRAAGRPQDIVDVARLERIPPRQS